MEHTKAESIEHSQFGPYRVVRRIERGGMGTVYLAERNDHQYRKRVAIKVIRKGLDIASNLQQFRNERQFLADLDHPHIARLLDGGTTEEGAPYLVMEYVDGERIDEYCDARRLLIQERLQLFLNVCSAVHYAHQRRVIHRDLKPSNVLITPEGEAKLLDFGVAKLLDQDSVPRSIGDTMAGMRPMTLEYASPEQVRGQTVSVATDIYSLGVLLYELLTGHRPYQVDSRFPHEAIQAICETEPEKPSASIFRIERAASPTSSRGALQISELRGSLPRRLRRSIVGDLDNIILMAMRKEAQRRYSSVEQLADDVRRHLGGLPVIARRDTLVYRSHKFVRRHLPQIIAAVLVTIGPAAGISIEKWHVEREKLQVRTDLLHRLNNILEAHDSETGLVVNTSSVIFEAGYVNLSQDARERLAKIAGIVAGYPRLRLHVEGHSDSRGDDAYNLAISEERAEAVKAYLVAQGVSLTMITAKGFGSTRPVTSNDTEAGRRRNRQVAIIVSGDLIGNRMSTSPATTAPQRPTASPNNSPRGRDAMPDSSRAGNLALNKPATGSAPCNANEGPEKAFNGSTSGGNGDKWCSHASPAFVQVDLGESLSVGQFIVRHAGAGGDLTALDTRDFNIQISTNGADFATVVNVTGNTQSVTMHTLPATTARFVRLNITTPAQDGDNADNSSRIYELEVYPPL